MFKQILILCLIVVFSAGNALAQGYSSQVKLGPNYYTVGYNLQGTETATQKYYSIPSPSTSSSICRTTLQKAINDISLKGGGVVLIKAGTYILDNNIIMVSKTKIMGEGIDKTILKLRDAAAKFEKAGLLRIHQGDSVVVSDLTLDGNKRNQIEEPDKDYRDSRQYGRYGLFTEAVNNVWFNRVKIVDFQGYGFDPHGWKKGNKYGQYLTITNCISNNNNWDGFTIDQSIDIYMANNQASNNGRHGYNICTGAKKFLVTNCQSTNNGFYYNTGSGCGYMVQNNLQYGTQSGSIRNSIATNNKKAGICANDVKTLTFSSNTMTNPGGYCFHLTKVYDSVANLNKCSAKTYYKAVETIITTNEATYDRTRQVLLKTDNTFTKTV